MSRKMNLSVLNLYNYNNRLFEKMVFPDGFSSSDKEVTINSILTECAELEIIYPDYNFMYSMIGTWSKLNLPEWARIYNASKLVYNPIENYNRTELETVKDSKNETHSGTDTSQASGQDGNSSFTSSTEKNSGSDTNTTQKTAYDSNNPKVSEIETFEHGHMVTGGTTGQSTVNYGRQDNFIHGEKIDHSGEITRENHTSGNIGVTTTQQMLEQEINITPALNVIKIIIASFKDRFCIEVY